MASLVSDESSLDDLRQLANHRFQEGNYDAALSLYTAAVEKADMERDEAALIINLCNRSACWMKMEQYEEAQADAVQALDASKGSSLKAFFRLAKAQLALKAFGAALGTIEVAIEVIEKKQQQQQQNDHQNIQDTTSENLQGQLKAFKELRQETKKLEDRGIMEEETNLTSIKDVHRGVSIREFIKEEDLGCGNFSEIVVCRHKKTQETFALKIIEKKKAADLAKRQHPNVYNEIQMERRVLLERLPHHVNVVRMYHAFQDYNSLYYLMDLHQGGEMWSSLRENRIMVGCHRSLAKVYLAELIDALEHIHSHGIVHRDLKPENILFTKSGHLLVIDFGTAKDLLQTEFNGPEFVGTPDFMSPEAVQGSGGMKEAEEEKKKGAVGADHTLDLYDLGAVAFQLHTGMTPYWSPSSYLTFMKIKRGNLMRPLGIADDDAWDFISSLMRVDPKTRLGADCFRLSGHIKKTMIKCDGGYDILRKHPYFTEKNTFMVAPLDPDYKEKTPIPTLRDLCIRACAELVYRDSLDLDLCEKYKPDDGSSHDMLRLDARDRKCVMHHLERRRLLKEPTVFRRFFDSLESYRLDKAREESRDYIGLTRMTDEQHKFPDPREHDPYAELKPIDPIEIVQIINPLLIKSINEACDDATRKHFMKLFKKCISHVNRCRPKVVVVSGYIDTTCRKFLARISDSIPVVLIDGSKFFSFWVSGVECVALQSDSLDEDGYQMKWIREELEQCRMAKYIMFLFADTDPRKLSPLLLKRLARGKAHLLSGLSFEDSDLSTNVTYECNETLDDVSIKSNESEEDDIENHSMKVVASQKNGLRCLSVTERDAWHEEFKSIEL